MQKLYVSTKNCEPSTRLMFAVLAEGLVGFDICDTDDANTQIPKGFTGTPSLFPADVVGCVPCLAFLRESNAPEEEEEESGKQTAVLFPTNAPPQNTDPRYQLYPRKKENDA